MKHQQFWKDVVKSSAVLNPVDRIAEVLFGLIMLLTFTGAISIGTDGKKEINELLWAALGCNVAWGLVDAIMYLMNILMERGHGLTMMSKIIKTEDLRENRETLRSEIQPVIASLLEDDELDRISMRLKKYELPPRTKLLSMSDFWSACEIFLLVFIGTLPVALPFSIFSDVSTAMRVSNAIALVLLFIGGYKLATYAGFRPIATALIYSVIGIVLVFITMALGG